MLKRMVVSYLQGKEDRLWTTRSPKLLWVAPTQPLRALSVAGAPSRLSPGLRSAPDNHTGADAQGEKLPICGLENWRTSKKVETKGLS